jgi:adenine phosphoribosyltransferase
MLVDNNDINDAELKEIETSVSKYPDFPKKGILFYDIFSIHRNPSLNSKMFQNAYRKIRQVSREKHLEFNTIVGLESRGFIIGIMLANLFNVSFVPIRKSNKLPGEKAKATYTTEYSSDEMEIQKESIRPDSKIMVVDDLLATGGTVRVSEKLIAECGGELACYFVVFEIVGLKGRETLAKPDNLISLINI